MSTMTAYGIAAVFILALIDFFGRRTGVQRLHGLNISSAGFMLGALGMHPQAWANGYCKVESR